MKKIFCITILLLIISHCIQAQWIPTNGPYGGTTYLLKRSAVTGFLYTVMNNRLFKTTNNAESWTSVTTPVQVNGMVIDTNGKLYIISYTSLYVSDDSGTTWTQVISGAFEGNATSFDLVGPAGVFVIGGFSGLFISTNKGVTWTHIPHTMPNPLSALNIASNSSGDLYYSVNDKLYIHPYGNGNEWAAAKLVLTSFPSAGENITSMKGTPGSATVFIKTTSNVFTAVGTTFTSILSAFGSVPGLIEQSLDGTAYVLAGTSMYRSASPGPLPTSWTITPNAFPSLYSVVPTMFCFISNSNYFAGSSGGGVFRTSDTGSTWFFKSIGLTANYGRDIEIANVTNKIFVMNDSKSYWTSVDGGANWIINQAPEFVNHIIKVSDGTLLLYGKKIFRSTDNGATFTPIASSPSFQQKIVEAFDGVLYSVALDAMAKSTDKGLTWTPFVISGFVTDFNISDATIDNNTNIMVHGFQYDAPFTYMFDPIASSTATLITTPSENRYTNVFFQNNKFYLSEPSGLHYSTDLGTSWKTISFAGEAAFPIRNASYDGLCVSKSEGLFVSQDNGASWNNTAITNPNFNAYITDIAVDGNGVYYAAGQSISVLRNASQLLVNSSTLPPYVNFNWQPLKGPYGGNVSKIEAHPDGATLYSISLNKLWKYSGTTWTMVDPTGTNSTIVDVEIDAGGNVYALPAAASSKVFKSVNGTAWAPLTGNGVPSSASFTKIEIVPNDNSLLLFGKDGNIGRIYRSTDNGSNFSLNFTGSSNPVWKTTVNTTSGAVASHNGVAQGLIVSTDFGATWTVKPITSLASVTGFVGSLVYDKNGNLLIHAIQDITPGIPYATSIGKSADNGSTFNLLTTPSPVSPAGAPYSKRIVALGTGEYLLTIQSLFEGYRSADGGATWTSLGNIGDVFQSATTVGSNSYVLGSANAGVLKTTDGGASFSSFSTGLINPALNEIKLLKNKDLVIGASRPYYSADFGQSFTLATMAPVVRFIEVKDSLIGYGGPRLIKSLDNGKTWTPIGPVAFFTYITANVEGTGFYATGEGMLYYSTDLINWSDVVVTGLPTNSIIQSMVITAGNIIYGVVQDFGSSETDVYRIVFGSAIRITSSVGASAPANIVYHNNQMHIFDQTNGIFKSSDGESWTSSPAPAGSNLIITNGYFFITSRLNNSLWLSRNNGTTWQSIGDDIPNSLYKDVVVNEYDGYAYATLTNSVAKKSGNIIIPDDKTKSLITDLSPANNATGVSALPKLSMTFDEVTRAVAGKVIRIFDPASPALPVVSLDMSTAVQTQKTWSVIVTTPLTFDKVYFAVIDPGAVVDIHGNAFAGVVSSTVWRFTIQSAPDTQAPSITFTADALQKSSGSKIISVTITDNKAVTAAKLSYRSITNSATVTTSNLVLNTSTNKYEITIPEASFGPMGLEYFITANDAALNASRSPSTGNHYSYIAYPAAVNPTIPGALVGIGGKVADWKIVTVPFKLADNRISSVLSELGAADNAKWRMINYKATGQWNEYPGDFSTLVQGQGYFVNMTSPSSLVLEGSTTPSWNKETPFAYTLTPGWNQIGNPYTFPMKWSEVLAANSNPAGISTSLKVYKGAYTDAAQLETFEGAFVLNSGTSNVTLRVPLTGSLAGGRLESGSDNMSGNNWVVPLALKIGDIENTLGGVGMHAKATISIDPYDDFNPPALFDFAEIKFAHPEHFMKQVTKDVVPVTDEFQWNLTVATNQTGVAQMRWDPGIVKQLSKDLYLMDVALQKVTDMKETSSYSFEATKSTSFKVYVGSNLKDRVKPERVSLGYAYPNPTTGQSTISFTIPESGTGVHVTLDVYNMLGQKIRTLADGDYNAGFYEAAWDASDASNAPGFYTYRLLVSSQQKTEVLSGKIVLRK